MRATRPRLLAGVVAMLLSALPFTAIALLVRDPSTPLARFDQRVDVAITRFALEHDGIRRAAEIGAGVLHPFVFRTAVVAVAAWLFWRGARAAALWAAATVVTGSLVVVALKSLVQRSRPVLDEPVWAASGFSFPSGHAVNAALGVTILLVLLWRPLGRQRRLRTAAVAAGVLLVLATSLDRLLLGVHFPTDVIAGDLTGVLIVASSWVAFGPVLRERARREADRAAAEGAP